MTEPELSPVAEISPEALAHLHRISPLLERHLDEALDHFYAVITARPEMKKHFNGPAHISGARSKQRQHWVGLARGEIGDEHTARAVRIGHAHVRVGLEPNYFVAGYGTLLGTLMREVIEEVWPKWTFGKGLDGPQVGASIESAIRVAMLDVELSITSYLTELTRRSVEASKQEWQTAAEGRDLALKEVGSALHRLSEGDLSQPITADLPAEFSSLKNDYNEALESLAQLVVSARESSYSVDTGAQEITSASDDLARRTEQQAASLEETAAALNEISSGVKQTSRNAEETSKIAEETKERAVRSNEVVQSATAAMADIDASSKKISSIITVIDEIAFQTNLLALNAGVEAARSGEMGNGFAVIAQEVRGLAQRSTEAAKEIEALIAHSAKQVERGVTLVAQTGSNLNEILEDILKMTEMVSQISASAGEQSTGLEEVNLAITNMDQVTQQNAAMVEQSAAVARQLRDRADDLVQQLASLQTDARDKPVARSNSGGPSAAPSKKMAA